MPPFDLADNRPALIALLRETMAADCFLMSPRIRRLKAIFDKLEPPAPRPEPRPPPKPPGSAAWKISV